MAVTERQVYIIHNTPIGIINRGEDGMMGGPVGLERALAIIKKFYLGQAFVEEPGKPATLEGVRELKSQRGSHG